MTRFGMPKCSETGTHRFPKDETVKKKWLKAIQRQKFKEELEVLKNQLQGKIVLQRQDPKGGFHTSKKYVIQDSVEIKFMCEDTPQHDCVYVTVLLAFRKLNNADKNSYRLNFRSMELNISYENYATVAEGAWHSIYWSKTNLIQSFEVNAIVEVIEYQSTLSAIHEDTELTDFTMEAVNGSVRVHRAVMGAASPVLRRMLSGEWREGASGRVQLPDTTRETLQHLKDFVYLDELPESGLRPLLLLARYLMMPALEDRCVLALADSLKPDTTYELLWFAYGNNLTKMVMKILERVACGRVKFTDITVPSASETSHTGKRSSQGVRKTRKGVRKTRKL